MRLTNSIFFTAFLSRACTAKTVNDPSTTTTATTTTTTTTTTFYVSPSTTASGVRASTAKPKPKHPTTPETSSSTHAYFFGPNFSQTDPAGDTAPTSSLTATEPESESGTTTEVIDSNPPHASWTGIVPPLHRPSFPPANESSADRPPFAVPVPKNAAYFSSPVLSGALFVVVGLVFMTR